MKPLKIILLCVSTLAILTVFLIVRYSINWPDAPFVDTASALGDEEAMALQAEFPEAMLMSPVFRRHMENRRNKYGITSQWFLFVDASGQNHRGHISEDDQLTVTEVTFLDALPEKLSREYFEEKTSLVQGGHVSGRVWSFTDTTNGSFVYEFIFEDGPKRGIGRVDASGIPASAYYVTPNRVETK